MKLSNKPQGVDKNTWYYEEREGIDVIREARDKNGVLTSTERFTIPWITLRRSLRRRVAK